MKRFTVSLPEHLYSRLLARCEESVPPATLQQMLRLAVDRLIDGESLDDGAVAATDRPAVEQCVGPTDLLVFTLGDGTYGVPIGEVESVTSDLTIEAIPSTDPRVVGMALLRGDLVEVVDGGIAVGTAPVEGSRLLAVDLPDRTVLVTVTSVDGLRPQTESTWHRVPAAAPPWIGAVAALADGRLVNVIATAHFLDS